MIIIVLEKHHVEIEKLLGHHLLQVKAGIFIGLISARIRDKIWTEMEAQNVPALMAFDAPTVQGFEIRNLGNRCRKIVKWDGIYLTQHSDRSKP